MIASEPVSESNDNLIGFIAGTVEKLSDDVAMIRGDMVTKNAFDAGITAVRGDMNKSSSGWSV